MSSPDYKRGYAKGYAAGSLGRWPLHRPPCPPEDLTGNIVEAARRLRDAIDGELATFDPDDPLEKALGPKIKAFDKAMQAMGTWLRVCEIRDTSREGEPAVAQLTLEECVNQEAVARHYLLPWNSRDAENMVYGAKMSLRVVLSRLDAMPMNPILAEFRDEIRIAAGKDARRG